MMPAQLNDIATRLGENLTGLYRILVRKGFDGSYPAISLYARQKRDPSLTAWLQIDGILREVMAERGVPVEEFDKATHVPKSIGQNGKGQARASAPPLRRSAKAKQSPGVRPN